MGIFAIILFLVFSIAIAFNLTRGRSDLSCRCGGACELAIHALNTFIAEQQNIAVLVIGGANLKENQAYAVEKKAAMPILTPQPDLVKEVYLVRSVPFTYVLDANGIIRAKGRINELEHIHYLLAEAKAPVLVTQTQVPIGGVSNSVRK